MFVFLFVSREKRSASTFFFAPMAVALDALRESIERHNDTFETLLTLIPARFYISKEPDETEVSVPTFVTPQSSTHGSPKSPDVLQIHEEQAKA